MKDAILVWMETNRLVRLTIVKNKAGRQIVVGRILHYDAEKQQLLVYDVDYKVTHHLKLNEIDEIVSD